MATKSLFFELTEKYLEGIIGRIVDKYNDEYQQQQYLHLTMLTEEYSADLIWSSSEFQNNIVAAGMVPIGAGENMQEASEPVLLASEPRKVWLVPSLRLALENYAYLTDKPCVSQEPMDSLLSRVYHLRQQDSTAVIIVSLHWGQEHKLQPVPRQRHDAHLLCLAGANVLVCHHTHTLQTIEDYGGHKIYYSVGNFIFDQHKPLNSEACMVRLKVNQDSLEVETIPVEIRHCVPYLKVKK